MTSREVAQVIIDPLPNCAMIFLRNPSFFEETCTVGAPEMAINP